jgi:hypothetical protein
VRDGVVSSPGRDGRPVPTVIVPPFVDPESNVTSIQVSLMQVRNNTAIVWESSTLRNSGNAILAFARRTECGGVMYEFQAVVTNGVGCSAVLSSERFVVDDSPPDVSQSTVDVVRADPGSPSAPAATCIANASALVARFRGIVEACSTIQSLRLAVVDSVNRKSLVAPWSTYVVGNLSAPLVSVQVLVSWGPLGFLNFCVQAVVDHMIHIVFAIWPWMPFVAECLWRPGAVVPQASVERQVPGCGGSHGRRRLQRHSVFRGVHCGHHGPCVRGPSERHLGAWIAR